MAPSLGSLAWTRLEARRRGEATIVVELLLGGTCNIVDQPGAFIFDNGAIFTHSHHEDCVVKGLRIVYDLPGHRRGQGHRGRERERSGVRGHEHERRIHIIFNGTIS